MNKIVISKSWELCGPSGEPYCPENWFERLFCVGLTHMDPTIRMNSVLDIIALVLGLLGVIF